MNVIKKIVNYFVPAYVLRHFSAWKTILFDPELRKVVEIILRTKARKTFTSELIQECDDVYIQRLIRHPQAYKMSFWQKHFEWQSLKKYPEISGKVLDFGCGSGHMDILLARTGMTIHGLDMSPIGIHIANYLRKKEVPEVKNRLSFEQADVTRSDPMHERYDACWSAHVFEHISMPQPIFLALQRWLKPGAHILISVPLGRYYDDPGHVNHFYGKEDLASFLEPHVQLVSVKICEENKVIRALCQFSTENA